MEKILPIHMQEVIFGSSDSTISKQISKLEKADKIRKIAPRLYTSNLTDNPEIIVRRNLFYILGKLYPGALLSHRSALEFKPTEEGHIFVSYKYTKKVTLPGLIIRFLEGHGPIDGDGPLSGELYASQRERALLENMQPSRKPGAESKTLSLLEIEEKLEQTIRVNGEKELNKVRDRAREISEELGMQAEFGRLDKIISALLTTYPSKILSSPLALARVFGMPYDPARLELFEKLFLELQQREFKHCPDKNISKQAYRNFAFFESYFSNYIEGTIFGVEEAKKIIETQKPLPARYSDSHDIMGTYQIVSSKTEMNIFPKTPNELVDILQYRHKILLSARQNKKPGQFKDMNNFAGLTSFVDFNLVRGTLIKSFDFYQALKNPFTRAAYMMFVISEVHPFIDGNGRIARVMMNVELVKEGQSKIMIPTVYRDDYMLALRKLSRQTGPDPYIRMLEKAHNFSETIYGDDMNKMQQFLQKCNAFLEHTEGILEIKSK